MSEYKTTLIGQENYLSLNNKSLFDYMGLPSGINKDILKNNILMRSGEFEALYADPILNQQLIAIWANRYYDTFNRWIKALNIEYNPLENFNRHEIIKDKTGEKETGLSSNKSTGKNSGENKITYNSKVETDDTTTVSEAAYNEADPSEKTETVLDGEVNNSGYDTTTTKGDNEVSSSGSNSVDKNTDYTRDAHLYGNIGVTTSQQMLMAELDIGYWNVYEKITDLFLREFCLLVY